MFHKLHRRLIIICTVGTAAVLLGMSVLSLIFSLSQLRLQHEEAFDSNLNAVFYYLQAQPVVDQAWLSRTEADGGLLIDVQWSGTALRFTGQDARREAICAAAGELAMAYGYNPERRPTGVEPAVTIFEAAIEGEKYRIAASSVPYQDGWFNVVILKSRAGEIASTRRLCVTFGGIAVLATMALTVFAYYFTGQAIKPVRESHIRQREFVSAASHELRSPLAVLRVGVGMLRTRPEQAVPMAEKLDAECAKLSRLVDDLLLLARADDGRWTLQRGDTSPKTLLLTAYERFEPLAANQGVALEPLVAEGLPSAINCDGDRIGQILSIFLDNAMEYTPPGGAIRLELGVDGKTVWFAVEDSGPGIPPGEREQVFERFYRSDASRSATDHHGLGLSVAQEIARLHSGEVQAEEGAVLGGARLVLRLPVA